MRGIFQKENANKARKYGIYRHLPTYEKIIRNLVSFFANKSIIPVTINATIRILKKSILFPPTILGIIQLLVPRL